MAEPQLIIVLGPTCVGKSRISMEIAKKFSGEIINCDSMQVYQGFDIGTAKVTPSQRKEVRHHLLDIVNYKNQFTAADFVKFATQAIEDILARKKLPIIVGGTGLYLKALLEGLFPGPGRDEELREQLKKEACQKGLEFLVNKLKEIDPEYYQKIGKNDKIRIIRALEVYYLTKKPMSEHFQNTRSAINNFCKIKIGLILDRAELYQRINQRVEKMFSSGLITEVQELLKRGVEPQSPPFRALGYKYALEVVKGEMSEKTAISLTQKDTRRYAKRQITWFKKDKGIDWFSPYELDKIFNFIENKLKWKKLS
ncbi:MAG: tRNA (adenosine(37)-N6)-dimethylallyltransferase MiaA [Candidatus Aminicenantia bacterium]